MSFTLSPTQIASYQQAGFLVLPGFKPAPELAAVRARAEEIVAAFEPGERFSIFSTHEQRRSSAKNAPAAPPRHLAIGKCIYTHGQPCSGGRQGF